MQELLAKRVRPFLTVAVITLLLCIAIARLPDTFVSLLQRRTPFTSGQIGWAYRLLALAAIAQALYGGFVLLRPDHVEKARMTDQKLAATSRAKLTALVARTASSMILFTLIYGIAAFAVGGQRGGFWLFPVIAVGQGVWYYREVGQIARWMGFQPETGSGDSSRGLWKKVPADYCPPIARGLVPVTTTTTDE